jgi:hypothetical protein
LFGAARATAKSRLACNLASKLMDVESFKSRQFKLRSQQADIVSISGSAFKVFFLAHVSSKQARVITLTKTCKNDMKQ